MDIENRIINVIQNQLGMPQGKVMSTSTSEDLGMDSLDDVEVIMAIEEEFNLEIPDEDCEPLTGVPQLVEYITAKLV